MNLLHPDRNHLLQKWEKVLELTKHIKTFTSDAELAWLADYATWCSRFLEIGSWRGRSAKVMLLANPGLIITCLDKWDDVGTFEEFQHNLGPEIGTGRVSFLRGPSQVTIRDVPKLREPFIPFNGCFIDGGHEEHLVAADIRNVVPLMRHGTMITGHDFRGDNDVARGVKLVTEGSFNNPLESVWTFRL